MSQETIQRFHRFVTVQGKPTRLTSTKIKAIVWDKTNGICWYCGSALNPWRNFVVEHVVSSIDEMQNLVPACKRCNSLKQDHDLETFRVRLEKKLHPESQFTEKQKAYLTQHSIELPKPDQFLFYFEREELLP